MVQGAKDMGCCAHACLLGTGWDREEEILWAVLFFPPPSFLPWTEQGQEPAAWGNAAQGGSQWYWEEPERTEEGGTRTHHPLLTITEATFRNKSPSSADRDTQNYLMWGKKCFYRWKQKTTRILLCLLSQLELGFSQVFIRNVSLKNYENILFGLLEWYQQNIPSVFIRADSMRGKKSISVVHSVSLIVSSIVFSSFVYFVKSMGKSRFVQRLFFPKSQFPAVL